MPLAVWHGGTFFVWFFYWFLFAVFDFIVSVGPSPAVMRHGESLPNSVFDLAAMTLARLAGFQHTFSFFSLHQKCSAIERTE